MTEWDGRGLPPAAQARIERARTDLIRSSLLTVPGEAAVRGVGLHIVGEVMGGIVEQLGWANFGNCGVYTGAFGMSGNYVGNSPTFTSGSGQGQTGFAVYVNALYHGYDTAVQRMLLEAQALGADGVVGVTCERLHLAGQAFEFIARGTAVAAGSGPRPRSLFYTDLSGADVAKLMHGGWMPEALIWGISVGIRHDDYYTRVTARSWSRQNIEIAGYTELVTAVRADARYQFHIRAAQRGADAATVSDMDMRIWGVEISDNHRDHLAESIVVGNALVHFDPAASPRTDSVLVVPLKGSARVRARR